jgi:hypothetical protein
MIRKLILKFINTIQILFFLFRTTEENIELTTSFFLDSNITNDTLNISIPEISVSPSVIHILQEIFRTYEPYCWRHSYGRGVGRPLHTCPDHASEQDGLLCYPPCRNGYNGVGPICWEKCENLTSFGFICLSIALSERHECPWYDKCGFVQRSCVSCAENYTKLGCFCGRFSLRSSYGRGAGLPLTCSKLYEQDGALCYEKCDKKYNGIGPVCWQNCPSTHPYSCVAGCSKTKELCQHKVITMIRSVIVSAIRIVQVVIGVPLVGLKVLDILSYAVEGEWTLVIKDIVILARELAEKILPKLAEKFVDWSFGILESAIKNASLLLTATALKDHNILIPIFKFFHFDSINLAFNHGKCNFDLIK